MKQIGLYKHLKFIGESTPKLCKFNIIYFDIMAKIYRGTELVHYEQQFKCNIEMSIVSTHQKNYIYIIIESIEQLTPRTWMFKGTK